MTCLLRATHRRRDISFNGKHRTLEPGQFVFGREELAEEANISTQQCRGVLNAFCDDWGFLTIKTTSRGSLATVLNWAIYQSGEPQSNQPNNQPATSRQPASNQPVTTNKNDRECEEHKEHPLPEKKDQAKEAAKRIRDAYGKRVFALNEWDTDRSRSTALKSIGRWLKAGPHDEVAMMRAIENRRLALEQNPTVKPQFVANFFGLKGIKDGEAPFTVFADPNWKPPTGGNGLGGSRQEESIQSVWDEDERQQKAAEGRT